MLRRKAEHTLVRVIAIYAGGFVGRHTDRALLVRPLRRRHRRHSVSFDRSAVLRGRTGVRHVALSIPSRRKKAQQGAAIGHASCYLTSHRIEASDRESI